MKSTSFKPGHPGAGGRPKGSIGKRSQELLEEAERRGVAPALVMFEVIEHFQRRAQEAEQEGNPSEQDRFLLEAVGVAALAAPYCHAKLRSIEKTVDMGERAERLLGQFTNEELLMRFRTKVIEHQPLKLVQGGGDT